MRCLRCALDFGPDERYCDRCGRALSRPLGEQPQVAGWASGGRESSTLYSTAVPPAFAAPAAPLSAGREARAALPVASRHRNRLLEEDAGAAPAVAIRSDRDERQEAEAEMSVEERTESQESAGPAPMSTEPARQAALPPPPVITTLPPEQLFGDEEERATEHGWDKPAVIGADLARSPRRFQGGGPSRALARRRLLLYAAILVVIVLALVVQRRYALHNDELAIAHRLEAQHQDAGALAAYRAAANDWPFDASATAGETRINGILAAQYARLQAAHATSLVASNRAAVLADWQALQRQAAARLDAATAAGR